MITKLDIRNFRSFETLSLVFEKPLIFIEGPNGIGKTTILEAIFFASTTKSHRTSTEKDMIMTDKPYLASRVTDDKNSYEIVLSENGKRTFHNKNEVKKISDYIGNLHTVMFAPEDLMLIKGGPSERRYFLDLELMQISKIYLKDLNVYKKVLKQRNILLKKLKNSEDYSFLNILSEQLYEVGARIYDFRERFINELNVLLNQADKKYENFQISLKYDPNITKEAWLKYLKTKQKQDILYETTMMGIHKDDFGIIYNGFNAKDYASQGTSRLIVIELKLALLEWIKQNTKVDVVLLLDDVLSELDLERQDLFLKTLPKAHQIFISSAVEITNDYDSQKIVLKKGAAHAK